ncbi:hypothetical protein FB451DRAFT_1019436 [Mycena latifolia]|nr:hypothetical protein FB451DRAFT_1019436 [Mycena latifolia]
MPSKGVTLVTGSAQGIGKAIALKLAHDGYDVALNDLPSNLAQLESIQATIGTLERRSIIVLADVSSEEGVKKMIETAVVALGSLDVMVANGGTFLPGSLLEMSTENWDRTFAVNCRGTWLCYKHAARQMIKQGKGGCIIGASSAAGKQGIPMMAAYSSTKFGIQGLTQVAAQELGCHKISVNSYAPGMRSPLDGLRTHFLAGPIDTELSQTALGYIGNPEDIASLVAYLVTPEAHFITG